MWRYLSVLVLSVLLLLSCKGGKGDESVAKRAGSKLGETLTDFATGVGKGVDTQMLVPVELSATLEAKGIKRTVAKSLTVGGGDKGFAVYLTSQRALSGTLVAKAFDKTGSEIGRSRARVAFSADDAKYVTFTFDEQMDANMVARYVIDLAGT